MVSLAAADEVVGPTKSTRAIRIMVNEATSVRMSRQVSEHALQAKGNIETKRNCLGSDIHYTRIMDTELAIAALGALAQRTRLEAFRLLVRAEPDGLAAGDAARALNVPQNTMSAHFAILARAGLVQSERRSRSIVYRADLDRLRELMTFLARDCCAGSVELCAPLIADLAPCC